MSISAKILHTPTLRLVTIGGVSVWGYKDEIYPNNLINSLTFNYHDKENFFIDDGSFSFVCHIM